MTPVLKEHREKNWRRNNRSKGLRYSFVDLNERRAHLQQDSGSKFEYPTWNMKRKGKAYDIFTFMPTNPSFIPGLE